MLMSVLQTMGSVLNSAQTPLGATIAPVQQGIH